MAQKNKPILIFGYIAGGTIAANRFVKNHTTAGQVVAATGGDPVLGVALNSAESGEQVDVCLLGVVNVEAGAAVAIDEPVGAGTAGKAAAIAEGVASADNDLAGMALEATTNGDGDLISVFMGRNPFVGNA